MKTLSQALLSLLAVAIMLSPLAFGAYQLSRTWFDTEDAAASTTVSDVVDNSHPMLDIPLNQNEPSRLDISPFSEPLVSVTFDDGWQDAYSNGFPLLEEYGVNTSQYLVSNLIGSPAYMSVEQIKHMAEGNHEIGGHTATHTDLTTLGLDGLHYELADSLASLESNFGNIEGLASPYSAYNDQTLDIIKQNYVYHRTADWPHINTSSNYDRYKIWAYTVRSSTRAEEISNLITQTKAQNGWLVLVYHEVSDSGSEYSVSPKSLESHLKLIRDNDLKAPTVLEVVDAVGAQR